MNINKKEKLILYSLGMYHELARKNLKNKSLKILLTKSIFIDFLKKTDMFKKGVRALYRNLEFLEKRKLLSYENQNLTLTKRGEKLYTTLKEGIAPYLEINKILRPKTVASATRKLQTSFK